MHRSTHPALRGVLAAAATVAVALSTGTAVAATASAKTACPSGYMCIYPGSDNGGSPQKYYRYGSYNLTDQYGTHLIVNNQTGGAAFRLCTGHNGQACGNRYGPGSYRENLTPINSIVLEP